MHLARHVTAAALVAAQAVAAALVACPRAASAESIPIIVVQNDGHSGGAAAFPTGLGSGDIIAVRLDSGSSFSQLEDIRIVFGGPGTFGLHPVTIKIWDDSAATLEPGPEIFSEDTSLLATESLQVIPAFIGTPLPARFRIGIVLRESTPPMVGHDLDGTLDSDRSFVMRAGGGWQRSQQAGATGDWIIRAQIRPFDLPPPGPGPGPDPVFCGGAPCPAGQFCDTRSRTCTFECVTEDDCGGAFCNRFGQCVGEGSGCCQTGAGGPARYAGIGLGLGVLALLLRRRRQRQQRR